jgi:hypothetical protein
VLHCVAHRLNNILKRTFYQQPKKAKKKGKITPNKTVSKIIIETERTPSKTMKKTTTTTTAVEASPEIDFPYENEENYDDNGSAEETSDDDEDEDDEQELFLLDYTATTIENLPQSAKNVLQTIKDCKALVKYVKKVSNRSKYAMILFT